MKKVLLVLSLVALIGVVAWAQLDVTLKSKLVILWRLSGSQNYSTKVAIPPAKRDTTMGIYFGDTGGLLALQCSLKVNSGGSLSMGLLLGESTTSSRLVYYDSTALMSARTTGGYTLVRYNLPAQSCGAITFSNKGTDTVWVKIEPNSTISFLRN